MTDTTTTTRTVDEFYNYEVPGYVGKAGKSFITISTDGKKTKVTLDDVALYFATEARNITSGWRTFAGIGGDWRPIDNLAQECLEYFKFVNAEGLRTAARKHGLEPKF